MKNDKVKSNKIRLRRYKEKDFEFLHGLLSDEATKKYFPFMYVIEKEQTFLRLKMRLMELDQYFGMNARYVIEDMREKRAVGEVSGRVSKEDCSCMEIAVLVHPDFKKELNKEMLGAYLTFSFTPGKRTFFRDVYKLEPGHYIEYDLKKNTFNKARAPII